MRHPAPGGTLVAMTAQLADGESSNGGPYEVASGGTVLLAADDIRTHTSASAALSRLGFVVQRAASAGETLEALRRRPPAALVLDLALPRRQEGCWVLDTIRSDRSTELLPIVVLTDGATPADARLALAHGADDFVAKPI